MNAAVSSSQPTDRHSSSTLFVIAETAVVPARISSLASNLASNTTKVWVHSNRATVTAVLTSKRPGNSSWIVSLTN